MGLRGSRAPERAREDKDQGRRRGEEARTRLPEDKPPEAKRRGPRVPFLRGVMFEGTNSPRGARGSKGMRKALETGSSEVRALRARTQGARCHRQGGSGVRGQEGGKIEGASVGVQAEGVP